MTLPWKTKSNRSISIIEDGIPRWLHHCYEVCCKKGGHYGRQACIVDIFGKQYHCVDVFSEWVDLYMISSIKDNITTSISYVHSCFSLIRKTLYYTINVTIAKAELFAIRCGINQTVQVPNIFCIIIIMNSIYAAQKISYFSIYLYQSQSIAISKELRSFFNKHSNNSIEFWDCPSKDKWPLYISVDHDIRKFNLTPIYFCKIS